MKRNKQLKYSNYVVFNHFHGIVVNNSGLIYQGCLDAFYPTTDPQLFLQSVRKIQHLGISRVLPGHHQLNIPVDIIGRIENGFSKLSDEGKLKQGNGLFDFGDFQIHI